MKIAELDFSYPKTLIAEKPVFPRDRAHLLVLDRKSKKVIHTRFTKVTKFLNPGDVLVFNNSKVFPARVYAEDKKGKRIEVLFLEEISKKTWEVLIGGRVNDGEALKFPGGLFGNVKKGETVTLEVNATRNNLFSYLEKYGEVPLPPYIRRKVRKSDQEDYQTVFAHPVGSAAAPTAGLHFTKKLLGRIKKMGVEIEYVTLHVGLGTFAPIRGSEVEEYKIHREYYEIDGKTAGKINRAKKEGRRVIACGTTAVRVLESAGKNGKIKSQKDHTGLFITPGFKFMIVDGLITNFHTPRSSLLALVFAFAGKELTQKAYKEAIKRKYRLFSYGDGMFIT